MGYYGVFIGLQYKNAREIALRLDENDYHESETITVKVPLAIPYHIDDTDYERVNGEIDYNGETLRLVKQKLVQDTLFIVCIKDRQSKVIKNALSDYVKTFADKPAHNHSGKLIPSLIKDFLPTYILLESQEGGWNYSVAFTKNTFGSVLAGCVDLTLPPPQV
jgi:hypothetical protein